MYEMEVKRRRDPRRESTSGQEELPNKPDEATLGFEGTNSRDFA